MALHCKTCGFLNEDEATTCGFCSSTNLTGQTAARTLIFTDLVRFPWRILLSIYVRSTWTGRLLLPLIFLNYLLHKLLRGRLDILTFTDDFPRFKPASTDNLKRHTRKGFYKPTEFMAANGFELVFEYEPTNLSFAAVSRLYYNPAAHHYAELLWQVSTGRFFAAVFGAYSQKTVYQAYNVYGIPMTYPPGVVREFLHGYSLEALYGHFTRRAGEVIPEPLKITQGSLLKNAAKLDVHYFLEGEKLGIFKKLPTQTEDGAPVKKRRLPCYFHPNRITKQTCAECGLIICEECTYVESGKKFCPHCILEHHEKKQHALATDSFSFDTDDALQSTPTSPPPFTTPLREGEEYAGFIRRAAAGLIDALLVSMFISPLVIHWLSRPDKKGLSGLIELIDRGHLFIIVILFYLFVFVPIKKSKTLGQWLFGLRVVDKAGRYEGTRSIYIRFAYYILSLFLIVPLLGYLSILFTKQRLSLTDRLSRTFVVARPSIIWTVTAWALVVLFLTGSGTLLLPGRLDSIRHALTQPVQAEAAVPVQMKLEPIWTRQVNFCPNILCNAVIQGQYVIWLSNLNMTCINRTTGDTLWVKHGMDPSSYMLCSYDMDRDSLLLLAQPVKDQDLIEITSFDPETGDLRWKNRLPAKDPYVDYESGVVVIIGDERIHTVNASDGQTLFSIPRPSKLPLDEYSVNKYFTLLFYDSETGRGENVCLDLSDGRILWREPYNGGGSYQDLGQGYRYIYEAKSNEAQVIDLADRRQLWKSVPDVDNDEVWGHLTVDPDEPLSAILFLDEKAISARNGWTVYTYPGASSHMDDMENYLLVWEYNEELSKGYRDIYSYWMLDALTGQPIGTEKIDLPGYGPLFEGEDRDSVYFLNYVEAAKKLTLVRFDKHKKSFSSSEIGTGIERRNISLFPEDQTLFLLSRNSIGSYKLPEALYGECTAEVCPVNRDDL